LAATVHSFPSFWKSSQVFLLPMQGIKAIVLESKHYETGRNKKGWDYYAKCRTFTKTE